MILEKKERRGKMFFLLLTGMIISFVTGTVFFTKGEMFYGGIGIGLGVLLLLFIYFYYRKKRGKDSDCLHFIPDCMTPDCDCDGPDCS